MSLFGALTSGVSGLQSQSSALGAIADNVANINTIGYKSTKVNFQTLVTQQTSLTRYSPGGVQSAPRTGVDVQGLLQATSSSTDVGISGSGFFVVSENAQNPSGFAYTRAGSFKIDKNGFLQNVGGFYMQGWPLQNWDGASTASTINVDGNAYQKAYNNGNGDTFYINPNAVDAVNMQPLNLSTIGGTARATSTLTMGANLPSSAANGSTFKTSPLIFDSLGNSHNLDYTWIKRAQNSWDVELLPPQGSTYVTMEDQTTAQRTYFAAGRLDFESIPAAGSSMTMQINGNDYTFNFAAADKNFVEDGATDLNSTTITDPPLAWQYGADMPTVGDTITITRDGPPVVTHTFQLTNGGGSSDVEVDISSATTAADVIALLETAAEDAAQFNDAAVMTDDGGGAFTLGAGYRITSATTNWNATGTIEVGGVPFTLSSNPTSDTDINVGGKTTLSEIGTAIQNGMETYFDSNWGPGYWTEVDTATGVLSSSLSMDANTGLFGAPANDDFGTDRSFSIDVSDITLSQMLDQLSAQINTAFGKEYTTTKNYTVPQAYAERVQGMNGLIFRQVDTADTIDVNASNLVDEDGIASVQQSSPYSVPILDSTVAWMNTGSTGNYAIVFNGDGTPDSFFGSDETAANDPRSTIKIGWANGALNMDGSSAPPGSAAITQFLGNYNTSDGFTQLGDTYQLNYTSQNGNQFGNFAGISISDDGVVTALFDNGVTTPIFMIPIATFVNPNGMNSLTGNVFQQTDNSGLPTVREAGEAGSGTINQATLESSTVDLGEEFTNMITTQRAYSAAAKIITTSDEMLDELVRIKR